MRKGSSTTAAICRTSTTPGRSTTATSAAPGRGSRAATSSCAPRTVEYHAPARFDDLLEIFVRAARIGRTSTTYECAAYRMEDDELMVTATQTLVLVDLEQRRPAEIPAEYRTLIRSFEGDDLDG